MNSSDDIKLFTGLNDHKSLSTMVQKSILATVAILALFLACFFGVDWTRVEVQPSLSPVSHKSDLNRHQLPGEASYPGKKIGSLPIRDIRVGMRVPARNPQVSDLERANFKTEVDPSTWRTFSFQLEKVDGSLLDIVMLRPSQWLAKELAIVEEDDSIGALDDRPFNSTESGNLEPSLTNTVNDDMRRYCAAEKDVLDIESLVEQIQSGGAIGSEIYFDLPELGAVGFATLLSNEPAPQTTDGPGSIVTATFRHEAASILDLSFSPVAASSNSSELTLGVTDTHPFWSVDRKDFVAAGDLRLYETVTALNGGEFRLTSVQRKPASETVFNFEVADEHVYYVGDEGILVHNSYRSKLGRAISGAASATPKKARTSKKPKSISFQRWKRGDAIDKPMPDGTAPSWSTVQSRYWKNRHEATKHGNEFIGDDLREMNKGNAPLDFNPRTGKMERRELHHVNAQRHMLENSPHNLREVTPDWHAEMDPFRHVDGIVQIRGSR